MMLAAVSTLDIVTLCVAIAGVSLAALSLGWQAATFVLSGSRVRLTLLRGALRHELGGLTRATFPLTPSPQDLALMRGQNFIEEVVVVEVRNRGRLAISVESVNAQTDDGWGFNRLADPTNTPLPHRLEPGSKLTWHVELEPLQRVVDNDRKSRRVRMTVELGTGETQRTKDSLLIEPRTSSA